MLTYPIVTPLLLIRSNIMPIAINLKKETAWVLEPTNILKLHPAYTILDLISSLAMRDFTLFL
ncbi:hypothetical protein VN1218_11400 [Helicobacter pylori]|nr:hypothetical protein VN1218_11400 [Helicobacter pylori]